MNSLKKIFGGQSENGNSQSANRPKVRKSKGYFLELDEEDVSPAVPAPEMIEGAAKTASATNIDTPEFSEPVAQAEVADSAAASEETATPAPPAQKKRFRKAKATGEEAAVAAAPAAATAEASEPAGPTTFAPDNLMPIPVPRRRPGANMAGFLEMADQMSGPRMMG